MTQRTRRTAGFTLLEILVAIAVFAIFSMMAYGGLLRLLDNRERIDTERAFWRDTTFAFLRIEQDFSLARNRSIRNISGGNQIPFEGQGTMFRVVNNPRNVEFTRGGILVPNGFTADLQRVAYSFEDGKLVRETWPVLDRAPTTEPVKSALLENVEEFSITFYDKGEWIPQWPPLGQPAANAPKLPRAVQMTLTLQGRGTFKRTFLVGDSQ